MPNNDNSNVTASIAVQPIGRVFASRADPTDDDWDSVVSHIELDASRFTDEALSGLDTFSHVEVLYYFHRVKEEKIVTGARHPRGNQDWPEVGIFAQRGKNRPNQIGATVCKVDRVEGLRVYVHGLDAIDASPVLDLKPVMAGFLPREPVREPEWVKDVMKRYW